MSFITYVCSLTLFIVNPYLLGSLANSIFPDTFLEKASNEPEFVEGIKNVTVPAGKDALLTCIVSNLGKYKVGWIRYDDQTILTLGEKVVTHSGRVAVKHDDIDTWNLLIKGVRESDKGCYLCQVNTAVMKKQIICIDVHVSPTIIDNETSADLTVREGENATLICKASGRPKPRIIWRREDGEPIMLRRGFRDVYKGFDKIVAETLPFTKLDRRQMGTFLCIATNDVPPAKSKRIVLDVNFPPKITVKSQLLGAPYGANLTLVCEIQSMPRPFVYWMKNRGEMLIDGSKYTIEETRISYKVSTSLTIRDFNAKDTGMYNCVSTNSLGKAEGTIRLHEIKLNKGTSVATEHHPATSPGFATPPISTEGHNSGIRHNSNNGGSTWTAYDVAPRDPVMTPHDPKSEVNRNDISAISSSSHRNLIPMFLISSSPLLLWTFSR